MRRFLPFQASQRFISSLTLAGRDILNEFARYDPRHFMSALEQVYLKLPVAAQHLACSYHGWKIQKTRYGGNFACLLRDYESRTFWGPDQIADFRDRRLRVWMRDCVMHIPWYQDWFHRARIDPRDIASARDLALLPILPKEKFREECAAMVSPKIPKRARLTANTSGTTGSGLRFATTLQAIQEQWAVWWRYRRWLGVQPGTWCGYFGGRSVVPVSASAPPFWRINYAGRQIMFSAYHTGAANLQAYVEALRRQRPPWLHGYPSLISLLAVWMVDTGADLGYQVKWVTLGAENLMPQQSEVIWKAFGVRPRQHYGMAEGIANISECPDGALHVDEDFSAVEFVPHDTGGYRLVGANFTNFATPLVRYDVHDVVLPSDTPCDCGRPGRVIAAIDGRMEDYIVLRNGVRLGRLDHIFKDLTAISEAQIYQRVPGAITVRVVRGNHYTHADEERLLAELRKRLGNHGEVTLEYLNALERSKTGKLRFVVSEIPAQRLTTA